MKKRWNMLIVLSAMLLAPAAAAAEDQGTKTVISFDGMKSDFTEAYIDKGMLPHFAEVQEHGKTAKRITAVYPSLTAASHAAMGTGAKPDKTGMISNHIHKKGEKLATEHSAFFSPLDASPIWSEARKQGKTTATVLFPSSNPDYGHEATYAVYYGDTWAKAKNEKLKFQPASAWDGLPDSFSPPMGAKLELKLKKAENKLLYIMAVDTNKDGKADYDRFYLSADENGKDPVEARPEEWGSFSLMPKGNMEAGFSFKIRTEGDLSSAVLFRTSITSASISGPEGFEEEINSKFGFFPVESEDDALKKGWISRKEYEEIGERFAGWTTDVSLYIKDKYKPDLLFFYYPHIDHQEHEYLLLDPRQPGYSLAKSKEYMSHIEWAYRLADKSLGDVLPYMSGKDTLFLVSDHGMEAVHSKISPNKLLKESGLLKLDKDGKVDISRSKAYAVASGSIAHIYINLEGREKGGIVKENEYEKLQDHLVHLYEKTKLKPRKLPKKEASLHLFTSWWYDVTTGQSTVKDSKADLKDIFTVLTGKKENPFTDVMKSGDSGKSMIRHENAGDVVLVAREGYYFAQDIGAEVRTADELGNHGGDPERRGLEAVFFAAGNGVGRGKVPGEISTMDIAPTLYRMLGLETPDFTDGEPISLE